MIMSNGKVWSSLSVNWRKSRRWISQSTFYRCLLTDNCTCTVGYLGRERLHANGVPTFDRAVQRTPITDKKTTAKSVPVISHLPNDHWRYLTTRYEFRCMSQACQHYSCMLMKKFVVLIFISPSMSQSQMKRRHFRPISCTNLSLLKFIVIHRISTCYNF
jgi:hypothetical protein